MHAAGESFFSELNTPGPCSFNIPLAEGGTIECKEIVRVVASKRIVCRGQWKGHEVYVKIFLGSQAYRYARRDQQGVLALARAGILAPRLEYAGADKRGEVQLVILEALENGINAEALYTEVPAQSQRLQLAKKLVAAVAHHHRAGLMQTDLYLKNFLLQGEMVYTLDGDAIRALPKLGRQRTALNNLALLISKFDVAEASEQLPDWLALYAHERHLSQVPNLHDMQKRIAAIRRRVAEKYASKKVFRRCTEVEVSRAFDRYLAIARTFATPTLKQSLEDPDRLLEGAQLQRLKSGNTCTVALAEIDGRKLVVKRYNIKNFWHGLSRALRPTRAAVSWSNAFRLKMHEVATAAPVALLEQRCGLVRRQAYFLAEYVDAPDAAMFFADCSIEANVRVRAAEGLARLFWKLYLLGISHGDFKASNVKMVEGRPLLIDLDSMLQHRCRWTFERRHVRDLRRFKLNWQQDPDTKALLAHAFRKFYREPGLLQRAGWL